MAGFYGFGSGLLGDWSCHTLDAPFWALGLGRDEALEVITGQIGVIAAQTEQICLDAGMPETTRQLLWRRSILNPDVCSNGFTHLDPG